MDAHHSMNTVAPATDVPSAGAPFWIEAAGAGACPVCASTGPHGLLSDNVLPAPRLALSGTTRKSLVYLRCSSCGTVYAPDGASLRYEDETDGDSALSYYLEEGAGIDLMVDPLSRLDHARIGRYAEVGCAFGFSLDFARRCFGWNIRGIDPSPLAAAGRDALNLPIEQRYFGPDAPLSGPPADLLQAAEVIEHVTDPHGFMRALLASLDETGILVISTPNAALLRDGTPDAMLLQVLQPGVHLTLFTADSLVALAQAHGLRHCHIHETPDDLTLTASRHPFAYDEAATCDRIAYLDYLRWRLALSRQDTPLRRGLMSRLLRELTLQGRFGEIDPTLADLFAEYRRCGVDLANPESIAHSPNAPFNVAAILYCLGMREVIARQDCRRAISYFDATVAWHAAARAPLSIGGVEDASAATVAAIAASEATSARIALDPAAEHDRCMSNADRETLFPSHRQMLFVGLVNRGDFARATVHHALVAEAAVAWGETSGASATGHRATTCFALGIFALNHLGDRPAARHWLGRSADLAALDPACEDTRYAAVIALHRAADRDDHPTPHLQSSDAPGRPGATRTRATSVGRLISRLAAKLGAEPPSISFADLSETPDPALLPPLDRPGLDLATLTPEQLAWWRDGVVVLPKFIPNSVTDPYIARRNALDSPGGWLSAVPYLQVPELKAVGLYPPLMRMLEHLIGEPMLLHLALSGWVSTERNWHQDDYLNPPFVNSWYAAVWIALDRIDPASGPFQYVPGSHRWPLLRGENVRRFLTDEERERKEYGVNHWPKYSERFVVPAIEAEIARRGVPPRTFLGEKGDVLIWHGRLMHRGTLATQAGLERRSLITHYSGLNHRPDMVERAQDGNWQNYAVFDVPLH